MSNEQKIGEATRVMAALTNELPADAFIIAGGFPRDLMNGKEISDVDYYINDRALRRLAKRSWSNTATVKQLLWRHDIRWRVIKNTLNDSLNATANIEILSLQGEACKHDLIIVPENPVDYVLRTFDIGLCKIWITSKGEINFGQNYSDDIHDKALTVSLNTFDPEEGRYNCGKSLLYHVPKVQKKYPEFKLVVKQ